VHLGNVVVERHCFLTERICPRDAAHDSCEEQS
jgi:hypothetical protein